MLRDAKKRKVRVEECNLFIYYLPAVDKQHFGRLNLFPKLNYLSVVPSDRKTPKE